LRQAAVLPGEAGRAPASLAEPLAER